jgi:hypothetical protein
MTFKREKPALGITIKISTDRKRGNGAVGGGRKDSTGKKAIVSIEGADPVKVTGSTAKDLLGKIRRQFSIPPHVRINEKGETRI